MTTTQKIVAYGLFVLIVFFIFFGFIQYQNKGYLFYKNIPKQVCEATQLLNMDNKAFQEVHQDYMCGLADTLHCIVTCIESPPKDALILNLTFEPHTKWGKKLCQMNDKELMDWGKIIREQLFKVGKPNTTMKNFFFGILVVEKTKAPEQEEPPARICSFYIGFSPRGKISVQRL